MSDKDRFPCAYPDRQAQRIDTTFWDDFSTAEEFGFHAIKDTYKRAFEGWKDNVKYLVELCGVMNHKCWEWNAVPNEELSRWYGDRYYEIRSYVYPEDDSPSPFSEKDRSFFYWVLD